MEKSNVIQPVLVIDTREQTPLSFKRLPWQRGTLATGDYSFVGGEALFAIERKSIADLVACCAGANRERFERELHRLRGFWFARLLIVGSEADILTHNYLGKMAPKSVLHTVRAFEARYVPIVWEPCPARAGEQVESWAYWFARELVKGGNIPMAAGMTGRNLTEATDYGNGKTQETAAGPQDHAVGAAW